MTAKQTTADLIRELAARPAPRPFRTGLVASGMMAVVLISLGVFWLTVGVRPDLASAWRQFPVQVKTALPLLLSLLATGLALRSSLPGARIPLWPVAVPLLIGIGLMIQRFGQISEGSFLAEAVTESALVCLTFITLLSLVPLMMGISLLRRAAPTKPATTGALLGVAVGAGIAAGYALYCTEDSPLFFVPWYGLAIALVASCGGMLGRHYLKW